MMLRIYLEPTIKNCPEYLQNNTILGHTVCSNEVGQFYITHREIEEPIPGEEELVPLIYMVQLDGFLPSSDLVDPAKSVPKTGYKEINRTYGTLTLENDKPYLKASGFDLEGMRTFYRFVYLGIAPPPEQKN